MQVADCCHALIVTFIVNVLSFESERGFSSPLAGRRPTFGRRLWRGENAKQG